MTIKQCVRCPFDFEKSSCRKSFAFGASLNHINVLFFLATERQNQTCTTISYQIITKSIFIFDLFLRRIIFTKCQTLQNGITFYLAN